MTRLTTILLLAFSTTVFAGKDTPEVKQMDSGIYWSLVARNHMYYVDTIAQLCFVAEASDRPAALAPIPCKNLKKRPEWSALITWE